MNIDENLAITIGGGFFAGALIGLALGKVLKILAVVVGLFFSGLAYLQYQQIVSVNWDTVNRNRKEQLQL
ncbi:MAG: FUN14 domain-containing protein [Candidatus Nitrosopolaris sp.]